MQYQAVEGGTDSDVVKAEKWQYTCSWIISLGAACKQKLCRKLR